MEGIALTQDMPTHNRQAVLNKWRQSAQTGRGARFLVAFDVVIKSPEVSQCPLVINYGTCECSRRFSLVTDSICVRSASERRRVCSAGCARAQLEQYGRLKWPSRERAGLKRHLEFHSSRRRRCRNAKVDGVCLQIQGTNALMESQVQLKLIRVA